MATTEHIELWKKSDDITVLKLLLEKGVDVNMIINDDKKWTKLNYAAYNKCDLVKILLTIPDIDINHKSRQGNTPLHMTSDIEIVKMLVEAGADINALNNNGDTPIMSHYSDKIKYLVSKGADLTIKNKEGKTIYDLVEDKSILKTPFESAKECVSNLRKEDIKELINYLVANYQ